jgi:hypothetical protein
MAVFAINAICPGITEIIWLWFLYYMTLIPLTAIWAYFRIMIAAILLA